MPCFLKLGEKRYLFTWEKTIQASYFSSILFKDSLQRSVSISGGFIYQGLCTNSASEQCSVFQAQKSNMQSEAALNASFVQSYQATSLTGQLRMKLLE